MSDPFEEGRFLDLEKAKEMSEGPEPEPAEDPPLSAEDQWMEVMLANLRQKKERLFQMRLEAQKMKDAANSHYRRVFDEEQETDRAKDCIKRAIELARMRRGCDG